MLRRIKQITIATALVGSAVGVFLAAGAPGAGNALAGEIVVQQAQTTGESKTIIKRRSGERKKLKFKIRLDCILGFKKAGNRIRGSYKCLKNLKVGYCAGPRYFGSQSASDYTTYAAKNKYGKWVTKFRYICKKINPNDPTNGSVCSSGFRGTTKKPIPQIVQTYQCQSFGASCAIGYKVVSGKTKWSGEAARLLVQASYRCSK